jgi:hypothetical protein
MGVGEIRSILDGFVASIIFPVIILILCHFIPAAKRNPKIVYGICIVLAAVTCFVAVYGGGSIRDAALETLLAAGVLSLGYVRASKAATPAS